MEHFTQDALDKALQICAAEPIHQIGSIQPHAALMVLSPDTPNNVLQVSANLAEFFDLPAQGALGTSLVDLIGENPALQIASLIEETKTNATATGIVNICHNKVPLELDTLLYISDGMIVVELCQDEGLPITAKPF